MTLLEVTLFIVFYACTLAAGDVVPTVDGEATDRDRIYPECGSTNPNNHVIDQSEPDNPGPFHDLTTQELKMLRDFLEKDPKIKAEKSANATTNSSYIFTADLLLPKKSKVLDHLDRKGPQPERQARVVIFRGDKSPAVIEEYVCGPLPEVTRCELLNITSFRNPVEFSVRALNGLEIDALMKYVMPEVDQKVGYILKESYGETFTECSKKEDCLSLGTAPVGTALIGDINKRLMWINALYNLPYKSLHSLNFAFLVNLNDSDPTKWTIEKVWYSNKIFTSLDDLISQYNNNSISKTKLIKPANEDNLFSSLKRRGEFLPPKPQRPPTLVEPDGKRYSVKNKTVEYMGWSFSYRLSTLFGPAVYDIRYKGERIAYELSLAEIVVLYSGFAPYSQTADYVDSGAMLGSRSKALVPGAGCPQTATLLSAAFMSQYSEEPAVYEASMCLFENNNGQPIRRHLSYDIESGAFYGGMLDSALILRSALSIHNYDYFIDYTFHQNGVIEARLMSSGYIESAFYTSSEKPYGHRIQENVLGNYHHHMAHFKVDLDIGGTSNRYETLDILQENLRLTAFPDRPYSQTKIKSCLKETELQAVFDFNFTAPSYHVVYNNAVKNKYNESRSYRINVQGMSKNLIDEDFGNEKSLPWGRHQMVVTKRKDDEISSSSIYGLFDSINPVVNFTSFYADDEDIVDEDLVFWITVGLHHIPHTEDIPVTPSANNHLSVYLMPHNYFPECPSMSSRDAIFIEHKDPENPAKGVKVERNGNSRDKCVLPKPTLEEDLEENPDWILESRRKNPTDF